MKKKKKNKTHGRRDPAVGLGGWWVGREVSGRGRDPSGETQPWVSSFRRDPSPNHRKEKKKEKKEKKTYCGSRRPTVGETLRRVSVAGVCTLSSFFLLLLSLLSLFSLFFRLHQRLCVMFSCGRKYNFCLHFFLFM
jgi:hypothetical protein